MRDLTVPREFRGAGPGGQGGAEMGGGKGRVFLAEESQKQRFTEGAGQA